MKTVFIVTHEDIYDADCCHDRMRLIGVFSTQEKAQTYIDSLRHKNEMFNWMVITEYDIDDLASTSK